MNGPGRGTFFVGGVIPWPVRPLNTYRSGETSSSEGSTEDSNADSDGRGANDGPGPKVSGEANDGPGPKVT